MQLSYTTTTQYAYFDPAAAAKLLLVFGTQLRQFSKSHFLAYMRTEYAAASSADMDEVNMATKGIG